ncbi:DUF6371 domain-containing protein [Mesoflavibacter sp. SCSIO 43206]|uniref:DUF6371 domain-containing protein n=1 Tax=Mesoflavibacter sp. SCSIO 43206 TaxID=2779362 RepID=UPI001CA979C4|nr:DUF6371 domain-containing protein [Mesoflavibacter sp. SCSIO 43206]UAB74305.1 hypothetical protein INR78_07820 [Mesoflavibacter sp. SCSIO 43206]
MKKNYKYILDKTSKKHICPNCNKKTLVRFIDTLTGNYLNTIDGRCDRETKCGYFKKPESNQIVTQKNQCIIEQVKPSYHNNYLIKKLGCNYKNNHFVSYLLKHFAPIDVKQAIKKYFMGTSNHWAGATVFWQIDQNMNIKAGKIMLYDCNTGKRVKQPYNHISWMHKKLKLNQFVLQQCLFGLHNLCDYDTSNTLCVVESEKTAIIMSIIMPSNLWLATGSKSGFKEEFLQPIKDYNIVAYPDKSEFSNWDSRSKILNRKGFNIRCSNLLENKNLKEGSDLVDLFLKEEIHVDVC